MAFLPVALLYAVAVNECVAAGPQCVADLQLNSAGVVSVVGFNGGSMLFTEGGSLKTRSADGTIETLTAVPLPEKVAVGGGVAVFASAGSGGVVYDLATRSATPFTSVGEISEISVSNDGKDFTYIAGTIAFIYKVSDLTVQREDFKDFRCTAFSPSGLRLALCTADDVQIFERPTLGSMFVKASVIASALPRGARFVSETDLAVRTPAEVTVYRGGGSADVYAGVFDGIAVADGLVVASQGDVMKVFQTGFAAPVMQLTGHGGAVTSLAAEGTAVASGGAGNVLLWKVFAMTDAPSTKAPDTTVPKTRVPNTKVPPAPETPSPPTTPAPATPIPDADVAMVENLHILLIICGSMLVCGVCLGGLASVRSNHKAKGKELHDDDSSDPSFSQTASFHPLKEQPGDVPSSTEAGSIVLT